MWCDAVQYLETIRKEKHGKEDADLGVPKRSEPCSAQSKDQDQDKSVEKGSDDLTEQEETTSAPTGAASAVPSTTGSSGGNTIQVSQSSSKTSAVTNQQPDANASSTDLADKEKKNPVSESHEDWLSRVTKAGQEVLWHPKPTTRSPTLLTGVQPSNLKSLETLGWEDKLETADLEKHMDYLRGRQFLALPHPLEATAWENGFVPETHGLPANELEPRILPLLPQLSHMVSAPRQPVAAGNAFLTRFDANIRPYWLRDWQTSFGGYTKVYEYQWGGQIKRMYSVAYVARPRTATSEACLCFSLMKECQSASRGRDQLVRRIHREVYYWILSHF